MTNKYLFIDIETSGLSKKDRVIEIGYVICDEYHRNLCEQSMLINHNIRIRNSYIHGITEWKLKRKGIDIRSALCKLHYDINLHKPKYIVAHNIGFDYSRLVYEFDRYRYKYSHIQQLYHNFANMERICTIKQFKLKIKNLKNYKLQTVYNHIYGEYNQTHRALDDVYMLLKCYRKIHKDDVKHIKTVTFSKKQIENIVN